MVENEQGRDFGLEECRETTMVWQRLRLISSKVVARRSLLVRQPLPGAKEGGQTVEGWEGFQKRSFLLLCVHARDLFAG